MTSINQLPDTFVFQLRIIGSHLSRAVVDGSWSREHDLDAVLASLEILTDEVKRAKRPRRGQSSSFGR